VVAFGRGVRKDHGAVAAAITSPWSNGQTEGQITKLKLVKRQMYGRGNSTCRRHASSPQHKASPPNMRQSPFSTPIHSAHRNVASAGVGLGRLRQRSRACGTCPGSSSQPHAPSAPQWSVFAETAASHGSSPDRWTQLIDGRNSGEHVNAETLRATRVHAPECVDGEATDAGSDFARHPIHYRERNPDLAAQLSGERRR
jgi:hypothetical protein